MAQTPMTFNCVIYPRDKSVKPYPATLVGYAYITGLGIGGGPIIPDSDAHPEHPIVLPPIDIGPPDQPPEDPTVIKPPPPDGGWGWSPAYGWGYFPGSSQPGPKSRR